MSEKHQTFSNYGFFRENGEDEKKKRIRGTLKRLELEKLQVSMAGIFLKALIVIYENVPFQRENEELKRAIAEKERQLELLNKQDQCRRFG